MITRLLHILLAALFLAAVSPDDAAAQRRITPVVPVEPGTTPKAEPDTVDTSKFLRQHDSQGNIILIDTVTGTEWIDTTAVVASKKMEYPLLHSVVAGVNIWDGAMRLTGQKYGIGSVWAGLSLHNRYMPVVEVGLGLCDDRPDGSNFTFKSPLSPYFKIGLDYNFLYNSTPDYQIHAGVRYGFTPFRYSIDNVTTDGGYWDDPVEFNIPERSSTAGFFEFLVSIKVKIYRRLSMGWSVGYHTILHEGKAPAGKPMYIPGFGKRGATIFGGFSIMYTIPLNKKPVPAVDTSEPSELSNENLTET